MKSITVVKIGGNVVDDPVALAAFLDDFARLRGPKILVHGGGREATRLSSALDIPTTMIEGRRVTTADTLDVVTMVYAGLINKRIVSALQARGCNALGLSGADADIITASRRPAAPVDYGYVGDIAPEGVSSSTLAALLQAGLTPVICAIMHDGAGQLLNCNADTVAQSVAVGASRIAPTTLVYCFEMPGVLADVADSSSVIPVITPGNFAELRASGAVSGGMLPKITNALTAVSQGVSSVSIRQASALLDSAAGTTIRS